jgi:hypothetical protein
MGNTLIGIDPDVSKSGVCLYNSKTNFTLLKLSYFELFDLLKNTKGNTKVYIEAGWLNKSNWHKVSSGSSAINANIGLRTGANHEAGRKIVEMCEYLKLEYLLIKPTRSKINSDTFNKITGFKKRTNQEVRDAAMLVFGK